MGKPSDPKKVVYLGDLKEVAEAVRACPGIELSAWIAEQDDDGSLETDRRVGNAAELEQALKELAPFDIGVIANFGIILSRECLSVPKEGFINAHMGLLPQYPGRLPIRDALRNGEDIVGVTLHRVTSRVDDGPVIAKKTFAVSKGQAPDRVFERMARIIPVLIREFFDKIIR